ncbi:MAG TPA: carboxy-S-adenosyl-L-methionine synthase CmoA [Opitutae bacterium]|nr:carboxy-S-adenosyl-L-methionine synthase CmoA [Opitutaceae bacterium]HCR29642.1 carboxy-S-adenosyl-L-methionine synthase CmoA [Opitutae bacterium]|tara:strand:- start:527 stop:1264 length:738 start_codon:yes stop_codon:yes gene_type:complete
MHPPDGSKDQLFARPIEQIGSFVFDDSVAQVFDDMIRRSVPGYGMTLSLMPLIAKRFGQQGTKAYDLGCSIGAGLIAIADGLPNSTELVGIDNAQPMLDRCADNLKAANLEQTWELSCKDILETEYSNASIALLNFTLQFVPIDKRLPLLSKVASGMNPGGALLLSEKIRFNDSCIQKSLFELHHDYKRSNGYSDMEVSQKRAALEDVLKPETIEEHKASLEKAGFSHCEVWFQCFNFASLLAIK